MRLLFITNFNCLHAVNVSGDANNSGKLLMKIQNNEVKLSGTDAEQAIKEIAQRAELINAELDIQNDSKGISLILSVVV
ncbi:MAG TPA: hypothetical protein VFW07_07100 [Parafilimonas sp.]|nr:hypothetical protein [Parafilimonas sp.]